MAKRDEPRPDEGRLERWSRLKREAVAEKKEKAEPRQAPAETRTAARAPAAPPDAGKAEEQKKIEDATKDLPPIESLGKESDYTLFMLEGVPEDKSVDALRKLCQSDPSFTEPFPFE
ncbi:MAG: DUF3306 domain-containing protein, partial [Rhodospirillales bacterium]|nr:DUF3306 domain-containing protein [Rhodospirillales bacterium]